VTFKLYRTRTPPHYVFKLLIGFARISGSTPGPIGFAHKVPEIRNTGLGELGKLILQVSTAAFSGAIKIFFGQRWLSPPRKIGPYAYDYTQSP